MPEEMDTQPPGNVEGTIKAVTELVKAVPVYQDAVQPAAIEAGKALQTIARTVNAALVPIRGLVWGVEQIEEFVCSRVSKKLEKTPVEKICTPDPAVAGPALESLRYTGHKSSLSELYANLLASAMDLDTAKTAHPGFVEIIRNMSSDEARVLGFLFRNRVAPLIDINKVSLKKEGKEKIHELVTSLGHDAACEHRELVSSYLVNLERLGLIEIHRDAYLTKEGVYDPLINDAPVKAAIEKLNSVDPENFKGEIDKYYVRVSVFGKQFGNACIVSRDKT